MGGTYPLQVLFATFLILAALTMAGCGSGDEGEPAPERFDAERAFSDLEAQVAIGPRPSGSPGSKKLVDFLVDRLEEAGAEDIAIQRPYRNVVATIPGNGEGTVVIGAHHDTKDDIPGFVGANDGASGVAVVLELVRVLAAEAPLDGPSISVALFDAEEARGELPFTEDGTRGSRQYVAYAEDREQGSPLLGEMRAMILFDLVGDCDLDVPREAASSEALYADFAEAAREVNGTDSAEPFEGVTEAVGDDHFPFLGAGVPALDIIDLTYGGDARPGTYWHTTEDTLDKVCPESLDSVGEPAVRVLDGQ